MRILGRELTWPRVALIGIGVAGILVAGAFLDNEGRAFVQAMIAVALGSMPGAQKKLPEEQ